MRASDALMPRSRIKRAARIKSEFDEMVYSGEPTNCNPAASRNVTTIEITSLRRNWLEGTAATAKCGAATVSMFGMRFLLIGSNPAYLAHASMSQF